MDTALPKAPPCINESKHRANKIKYKNNGWIIKIDA